MRHWTCLGSLTLCPCLQIPQAMLRDTLFKHQPEQSFHNAMVLTNHLLHEADLDDTMSGTTAINVLLRGNMLYVANVGDSRAVLAERQGDGHVAVPLSMDQTPFRWLTGRSAAAWQEAPATLRVEVATSALVRQQACTGVCTG